MEKPALLPAYSQFLIVLSNTSNCIYGSITITCQYPRSFYAVGTAVTIEDQGSSFRKIYFPVLNLRQSNVDRHRYMAPAEFFPVSYIYDNRIFVNSFLDDMADIYVFNLWHHFYHHQMLLILYGIRSIGKVFVNFYS